jgi:hypothetical protein
MSSTWTRWPNRSGSRSGDLLPGRSQGGPRGPLWPVRADRNADRAVRARYARLGHRGPASGYPDRRGGARSGPADRSRTADRVPDRAER